MKQAVSPEIEFNIKRMRRKTVAIHVQNNSVEVRAPYSTSKSFIDEFVAEKRQWIINKLLEQEQKESEVFCIEDGAVLPFMGFPITIQTQLARRNSAKLVGEDLYLKLSENSAENRCKLMDKWLLQQAKHEIPDLVQLFAKDMKLWHKVSQIKFRKTKSKWGHCTATGILQFNPLILLAPESILNYLIVHELCHLVHQNHSKSYWLLVSRYNPKYQESEKWLKQHGHKLWYR